MTGIQQPQFNARTDFPRLVVGNRDALAERLPDIRLCEERLRRLVEDLQSEVVLFVEAGRVGEHDGE